MNLKTLVLLGAAIALLTGASAQANMVLNVQPASGITVNGDASDWALGGAKIYGGDDANPATPDIYGDVAYQGWDGASYYEGSHWTAGSQPGSQADHTAQVYARYDSTHLYFLAVVSDSDVNTPNDAGSVWANDCMEIYIDPGNDGPATALDGTSTSEIQLVVDAIGQHNVYMTTGDYATQVLAGVQSAGSMTANGYIIEVSIALSVLDPDLPNTLGGRFGLDLAFRDNDNYVAGGDMAGTPADSTMYSWSDPDSPPGYPSKIPSHWGDGLIVPEPVTLVMLVLGGLLGLRRRR